MPAIYASFPEKLDTSFISAVSASGGSTTQAYNYNYYFQFENRAGKNLLSDAIALTVNAGEKAVFTFNPGLIASGSEVIWIVISAESTGNEQDAVQLARVAIWQSDQLARRSLPLTLELETDIHFLLSPSVADHVSLPAVADVVFGAIYLVVAEAQYYIYDEWASDWVARSQGQSTYLAATTGQHGSDRVLSDVDIALRVPTKIGNNDTVPLRIWWLNGFSVDGLSPQVANTVLSFEFAVNGNTANSNGKSYNAIFSNRLKVSLVGYVERATVILTTSMAQSQLIWNPITNPLLLPVDLPRGYAAALDLVLSFNNEELQGIILPGSTIDIDLIEAFDNVGIPSPVAKTTGDLVFAESDRLRIVPAPLRLSGSATIKAGYLIDSKKEIPFPGLLTENTAEQKICLSGSLNGFVTIRQPGETLAVDEIVRAIASTEAGKGQVISINLTLAVNSAVEITINFPDRVRDDYPDVIAGNSKGTFTPLVGRVGVGYNSVFYEENTTRILGTAAAITFVISDLTNFSVSSLHTPDADFDLFRSEIIATEISSGGSLGGTYTFYFWHEYESPNTLITKLSHDSNNGAISELVKSLAEIDGDMSTSTYDIDEDDAIDIEAGGTSAKTPAEALANLGGISQAQLDQAIADLIAQGLGSPYLVLNTDAEASLPTVLGTSAMGLGDNAQAEGDRSFAFGQDAYAGNLSSIAFGNYAFIQGDNSLGFGENANVFADNAIQLGQGTNNNESTLQFLDTPVANVLSLEVAKVNGDPNGTVTARQGTLILDTSSGSLYVNTDAGTTWSAGSGGSGASNAASVSVSGTPSNYSPGSANVEAHLSAIDSALGSVDTDDQTASEVPVTATPNNYSPASANVEAHLVAIDSALASAGGAGAATALEFIQRIEADGTTDNYTFSSIPNIYQSLAIKFKIRGSAAFFTDNIKLSLNGDTTEANYHRAINRVFDNTPSHLEGSDRVIGNMCCANAPANAFAMGRIIIEAYKDTDNLKIAEGYTLSYSQTGAYDDFETSLIQTTSTSAIVSLTLSADTANNNFVTGSYFELYGYRNDNVGGNSGTVEASSVNVSGTPTNYSPGSANVESHLSAIDSALASAGGGGGTITDFTSLYLEFNEVNGSTTFVDSSANGHIVSNQGNTIVASNAQSISDVTSASLSQNSATNTNYLEIADSTSLRFESDDFTIECWMRWNVAPGSLASSPLIYAKRNLSTSEFLWFYYNGNFDVYANNSVVASFPFTPSINTWYHIAASRESTTLRLFVDGSQIGSDATLGAITPITEPVRLFCDSFNNVIFDGYIDELRVLKGKALYTSNFTAPTAPLGLYTETSGGSSSIDILQSDRTYYISTSGDDNNDGLSVGAPKTLQGAIDTAVNVFGRYNITLQLADGTYAISTTILLKTPNITGKIIIQGNSANAASVILDGSADVIRGDAYNGRYLLKDLTMQTSSGNCVYLFGNKASILEIDNLRFGSCTSVHLAVEDGNCSIQSSYEIFGGAAYHVYALSHAFITYTQASSAIVVTLTGTPNFSSAFAIVSRLGILVMGSAYATFSGSATGSRYIVSSGAIIDTGGAGVNYLPGNTTGSTSTNGQYL